MDDGRGLIGLARNPEVETCTPTNPFHRPYAVPSLSHLYPMFALSRRCLLKPAPHISPYRMRTKILSNAGRCLLKQTIEIPLRPVRLLIKTRRHRNQIYSIIHRRQIKASFVYTAVFRFILSLQILSPSCSPFGSCTSIASVSSQDASTRSPNTKYEV